jgi:AraC family transcriptional regulator
MNPVARALWFVESHFTEEITLDDVARAGGVSRYHMARVFAIATGRSIMRYVRGRRLTEAARVLVDGAPDILTVALDSGYGSHEAFTRAFRDQFGMTPEALRARGSLDEIELTEPIKMDETLLTKLEPPRIESLGTLLIAGIGARYTSETIAGVAAQWQRFAPYIGHIPGQVGKVAYGVICNSDDSGNIEYICGVEVSDFSGVPADWSRVRIQPQRYAVFTHRGHISGIRQTWLAIFNQGLQEAGLVHADGPEFERYDEKFDPRSGMGEAEIWIPVRQ